MISVILRVSLEGLALEGLALEGLARRGNQFTSPVPTWASRHLFQGHSDLAQSEASIIKNWHRRLGFT
jgi:hypothetical protein